MLALLLLPALAGGEGARPLDHGLWPLVTPLLGVGEPCRSASLAYIGGLQNRTDWAVRMLDSSGHLPFLQEGLLSDVVDVPLDLCSALEGVLAGAPCPDALANFSLKVPFGHATGLGSQDGCTSVEGFATQYCHNALFMAPTTMAKMFANPTRAIPHSPNPPLTTEDKLKQIQQQALDHQFKTIKPAKPFQAVTPAPPQDLPDSSLIIEHLLKQNPTLSLMIQRTSAEILSALHSACPDCKAEVPIDGYLVMLYAMAWMSVNSANGGGDMSFGPWPLAAYRACYPAACTKEDMLTNSYLFGESFGLPISVTGEKAFLMTIQDLPEEMLALFGGDVDPLPGCTKDDRYNDDWKTESIVAVTFFGILSVFLVIGTIYDIYGRITFTKKTDKTEPSPLLLAFSLLRNFEFLISPNKAGEDRLDCVEGIRALSMTWVVLGHSFAYSENFLFVDNKKYTKGDLYEEMGMAFRAVLAGPYSVDTFFFIGATLVSYLLLKDLDRTEGWGNFKGFVHMIFLYVNRILRITIPYGIFILFLIGIPPLVLRSPMGAAAHAQRVSMGCSMDWYKNLLYVQNFNSEGTGSIGIPACIPQAWFLGSDMWYFAFSPLLVYPLWLAKFGRVQKVAAFFWWSVWLALSVGFSLRCAINMDIDSCWLDVINNPEFAPYGRRSQCYIMGLLLGYVLHTTKKTKVSIPNFVNLVTWIAVLMLFFALVYAPYNTNLEEYGGEAKQRFWYSCSHLMWGICLFWLIFACCRGYGGIINDLLTWSGWSPIAKVSFMTYLVHMDFNWFYFLLQVFSLQSPDTHLFCRTILLSGTFFKMSRCSLETCLWPLCLGRSFQ